MNIKTAQSLLYKDIEAMSLEQLQAHRVRLIDAWRESRAEYGFSQAVKNGFYQRIASESANGFLPTDIWLTVNLNSRIETVCKRETYLFSHGEETNNEIV